MSSPSVDPQALARSRDQIRRLADEIAELSKLDLEPQVYFEQFLKHVVTAVAALGGAVWNRDEQGQPALLCQINLHTTEIAEGGEDETRHARLIARALEDAEPLIISPYAGEDEAGNPTRFLLILVPLLGTDHADGAFASPTNGIVEIFQRPGGPMEVQQGYLRFLTQMCQHAGDWLQRRHVRELNDRQSLLRRIDEFARTVHESLDRRETAFVIANEARLLLTCDRVSVAVRKGNQFALEAISGQDTVDRRSNMVVLLQTLVRKVLAAGEPLWYTGGASDLPPQIEQALEEYVDLAQSKAIGILPLRRAARPDATTPERDEPEEEQGEIVGAMVVEQIEDRNPVATLRHRTDLVAPHAARALANAHQHASLFLMPLWRALGSTRILVQARHLPKTLLASGALVIGILVCLLVPMQFKLEGRGHLQPVQRHDVFAGIDGVVSQIHVQTGDQVQAGDPLVTLYNPDLLVQLETVEGQLQTTREQVLDLERRLLNASPSDPSERVRWASELAQLRRQWISLQMQQQLLLSKKQQLVVVSPIAGEVITWDVQRLLRDRPITPGQVLLTVADLDSDWELVVQMPEDNIGYITAAQQEFSDELDVTYILATDPGHKLTGTLREVHRRAEPHETEGHTVKLAVDINETDIEHPRPGAMVTAEVHCGYRSIAFVWLHDVVEFLQTKVFF